MVLQLKQQTLGVQAGSASQCLARCAVDAAIELWVGGKSGERVRGGISGNSGDRLNDLRQHFRAGLKKIEIGLQRWQA